jgi:hypothetical protein
VLFSDIQSLQFIPTVSHVFPLRSRHLQQGLALLLLVSSTIWMVVPQAFAGSSGMVERGWLTHFLGDAPVQSPGNGFKDASDPGALIVQPVLVAAQVSAPTVQKRNDMARPAQTTAPAPGMSITLVERRTGTAVSFARLLGSSVQRLGP